MTNQPQKPDIFSDLVEFKKNDAQVKNVPLSALTGGANAGTTLNPSMSPAKNTNLNGNIKDAKQENIWNFDVLENKNAGKVSTPSVNPISPNGGVKPATSSANNKIIDDLDLFLGPSTPTKSQPSTSAQQHTPQNKDDDLFLFKDFTPDSHTTSKPIPETKTPLIQSTPIPKSDTSNDANIAFIVSNGYSVETAVDALLLSSNNPEKALQMLRDNEAVFLSVEVNRVESPPPLPQRKKSGDKPSVLKEAQKLIDSSKKKIGKVFESNESLNAIKNGFFKTSQRRKSQKEDDEEEDYYSGPVMSGSKSGLNHASSSQKIEARIPKIEDLIDQDMKKSNMNTAPHPINPTTPQKTNPVVSVDLLGEIELTGPSSSNTQKEKIVDILSSDLPPPSTQSVNLSMSPVPAMIQPIPLPQSEEPNLDIFKTASPAKATPVKNNTSFTSAFSSPSASTTNPKVDELKQRGNDFFKSGQYSDAVASYTSAINITSQSSPIYHQLLNNRAAACLKTGEYSLVISDTSTIIDASQNRDDLRKAYSRRALAYENLEKWDLAKEDYTRLLGIDGGKMASDGLSRANAALRPKEKRTTPKSSPKPIPKVERKVLPVQDSAMISNLREKEEQKVREDDIKISLQDDVDARILSWKKGKENNIRALLSSLDSILWKESGVKNVPLSDLIQPNNVKKHYMKAVAKIHPDKLDSNVTVEQKMIASTVFTILNEAWDAFKVQNKLV